jgi:AcrR family transcriptional regulator
MAKKDDETGSEGRAEVTRERLLTAALDLFGRYGFDGVSTRAIAEAAGVNLQAINYHFGTKRGLYIACADYVVAMIDRHVGPLRAATRQRLADFDAAGVEVSEEEARRLLLVVVSSMLVLFMSDASAAWARLMVREQAEPTEAFERVYAGIMEPMLALARRLIGRMANQDPDGEWVRLRALTLVGSVLVFRVGRATLCRQMQWQSIGPAEVERVRSIAVDIVAAIRPPESIAS